MDDYDQFKQCLAMNKSCRLLTSSNNKQVAQLSQRDRTAGWVSYGQKWKTVNGRQYFTDIIGRPMSSTTMM